MRTKLSKKGWFEFLKSMRTLARRGGVTDFQFHDCGCGRVKFSTGFVKKERCLMHKYKYPRWCPCGKCAELSLTTAAFHKLRDNEAVDRLRAERAEHFPQCVTSAIRRGELVKDEYEGWTYPEEEEEKAS